MTFRNLIFTPARKGIRFIASLKAAIPLLVITIAATIVGSLFPQPDLFKSWWYLGLLALNGISLLFITILHIPLILKKKGRNALIGVVMTHLGIIILIAGFIYGGVSGFRHQVKLIEGEITVVPGLPFVIKLDELVVEEYRQEDFPGWDLSELPKKQQDSRITLLKNGKSWLSTVAAPGNPAVVAGISLLPSISDTGWYFELIVTEPRGDKKVIPVRPWAPPMIIVGDQRIMTHTVAPGGGESAELFTIKDETMTSLGYVSKLQPLVIEGNSIALGSVKRYTGIQVYNRPQEPILVLGSLLMLVGLVWHFYFRHRKSGHKQEEDSQHV
jgi:cytochrome c biogenesis protein ResB